MDELSSFPSSCCSPGWSSRGNSSQRWGNRPQSGLFCTALRHMTSSSSLGLQPNLVDEQSGRTRAVTHAKAETKRLPTVAHCGLLPFDQNREHVDFLATFDPMATSGLKTLEAHLESVSTIQELVLQLEQPMETEAFPRNAESYTDNPLICQTGRAAASSISNRSRDNYATRM